MTTPEPSSSPPPPDEYSALSEALGWNETPVHTTPCTREEVALLEECVAAAILTAPAHRAPAHCLAGIRQRIAAIPAPVSRVNGHRTKLTFQSPWRSRAGWGVAAALAILAGWQTVRVVQLDAEMTALKADAETRHPPTAPPRHPSTPGTEERGPAGSSHGLHQPDGIAGDQRRGPAGRARRTGTESMVVSDPAALEQQLRDLQRLNDSRFQPVPGLARTVVAELKPAGAKPGTAARNPTLSDDVAAIIAAGMEKEKIPEGERPPFKIVGRDQTRPGDDFVVEGLPNLSGFNIQEGVTLLNQDFPADTWQQWEGLHLLKDGSFYDEVSDILWKPLPGEGRRYAGKRPSGPILLDEQAAPREWAAPPGPAGPAGPALETPPAETSTSEHNPLIWSIYDESRGEGSLVVRDLPPPPDGKNYQLWFEDARASGLIYAGTLPALENNAGEVLFSLTPGISPVHYRLTLEPSGASKQPSAPTGPIVLTGP